MCQLEATCGTLNTRLEQRMALNDELVADKGRLTAQVGAAGALGAQFDHSFRQEVMPTSPTYLPPMPAAPPMRLLLRTGAGLAAAR